MAGKVICKGKNLFLSTAVKLSAVVVSIAHFVLICVVPESTYTKHKKRSSHRPSTTPAEHGSNKSNLNTSRDQVKFNFYCPQYNRQTVKGQTCKRKPKGKQLWLAATTKSEGSENRLQVKLDIQHTHSLMFTQKLFWEQLQQGWFPKSYISENSTAMGILLFPSVHKCSFREPQEQEWFIVKGFFYSDFAPNCNSKEVQTEI